MTEYWQHRITYMGGVSYPLLDEKRLLSAAFSDFADEEFLNRREEFLNNQDKFISFFFANDDREN